MKLPRFIHTYKACLTLTRKITADVVSDAVSAQCVHKGAFTFGWVSNPTSDFRHFLSRHQTWMHLAIDSPSKPFIELPTESSRTQQFYITSEERSLSEPQRFTYLYPSRIVSYAILRPLPLEPRGLRAQLPVIAVLHWAGLEADTLQTREMFNAAYGICAWLLFPSGITSWSGDNWRKPEALVSLIAAKSQVC